MDTSGIQLRSMQVGPHLIYVYPANEKGMSAADIARWEEDEILRKADAIRLRREAEAWRVAHPHPSGSTSNP